MGRYSIGIAGAGIAGLALAAFLARAGHSVVVFDKLAAPAPLGSGLILQPVGLRVLDQLGLARAIRDLGAPIERLFGRATPQNRVVLDVHYPAGAAGLGVHRGALFDLLLKAAQAAGAGFEAQSEVTGAESGRFAMASGRRTARFDLLIDALGVRSPLSPRPGRPLPFGALWASLDWPAAPFDDAALEQRYVAARKMVGVMPIGRLGPEVPKQAAFFWSLKGEDHAAWTQAPLSRWKDEVRAVWPHTADLLEQIKTHNDLVYARYAHRTLATPIGAEVVHVGDSWHCTSPQLGQGANLALLDAYALSAALGRQPNLVVALSEYARMRSLHVWAYQTASFLFTPFYQSDSALIAAFRDHVAAPASRIWPGPAVLSGLVAGVWGGPLAAIEGAGEAMEALAPHGA